MTKPLFPPRNLYLDEDKKTYHLEFDGFNFNLVLTHCGAKMIKVALCNLPIYKTFGQFWGYKHPKDRVLVNSQPPKEYDNLVQLSSNDEIALIAIADILSDARCWKVDTRRWKADADTRDLSLSWLSRNL
mgnify:FL=1